MAGLRRRSKKRRPRSQEGSPRSATREAWACRGDNAQIHIGPSRFYVASTPRNLSRPFDVSRRFDPRMTLTRAQTAETQIRQRGSSTSSRAVARANDEPAPFVRSSHRHIFNQTSLCFKSVRDTQYLSPLVHSLSLPRPGPHSNIVFRRHEIRIHE